MINKWKKLSSECEFIVSFEESFKEGFYFILSYFYFYFYFLKKRFFKLIQTEDFFCISMEYCSNGSLADLISKRKTENKPFSYTV
jgi:serine/threonine protein kinase